MSMNVTSTHAKNPAEGWDISAAAKADQGEKIARVQIILNGFTEYDKSFAPPVNAWQQLLIQRGEDPGDNTVEVIATNDDGEDTESEDSWS
jgi:hypothetical protein